MDSGLSIDFWIVYALNNSFGLDSFNNFRTSILSWKLFLLIIFWHVLNEYWSTILKHKHFGNCSKQKMKIWRCFQLSRKAISDSTKHGLNWLYKRRLRHPLWECCTVLFRGVFALPNVYLVAKQSTNQDRSSNIILDKNAWGF
jgi:hypothetical protein